MPESILDCKSVEITKHFPLPAGSFSETSTFFQVQNFQVQKIRFIFRFTFSGSFCRFILQVQFFRFISRFSFSGSFSRFSFQVHLFRFIFQVQKCKHSRNIRLTLCKTFQVPTWRNIIYNFHFYTQIDLKLNPRRVVDREVSSNGIKCISRSRQVLVF